MKATRIIFVFTLLALCAYFAGQASNDFSSFPASQTSFYKVPLVCEAAPHIGCGSKAKPILKDLEKQKSVAEAWLNREGTVLAVVWATDYTASINKVLTSYNIEPSEISGTEREELNRTFGTRNNWLRSSDVDKLSIEEAGVIATGIIEKLKEDGDVRAEFEEAYRKDIEKIFVDLFLSINSLKELTTKKYNQVEKQIQQAGEKYVGKGNMPIFELCPDGKPACCEEGKSSCSTSEKSCCKKN